jgi:hypothetical protein
MSRNSYAIIVVLFSGQTLTCNLWAVPFITRVSLYVPYNKQSSFVFQKTYFFTFRLIQQVNYILSIFTVAFSAVFFVILISLLHEADFVNDLTSHL